MGWQEKGVTHVSNTIATELQIHILYQTISEVQWQSPEGSFTRDT